MALAARGRVKFHESGEFVAWQGSAHTPFVYVIQQGTVSLWETTGGQERLRDIRGAGDMLGIERYLGSETYRYSAKTTSDVVVYAFPANDFEPLLEKYPHAGRYVASQASVTADYQPLEQRRGAHQVFLQDAMGNREPLTCPAGATIRDAARLMSNAGLHAIAVVDADGARVIGVVTAGSILAWIATAGNDPGSPVDCIMSRTPCTIAPEAVVSQCILAMADSGTDVVVTTGDGTADGRLHSLVTPADVSRVFGGQPLGLLREIAAAPDLAVLRTLQLSLRAFLLDQLIAPSSLDWLASYGFRGDASIVKRIVDLTPPPGDAYCLSFYGQAGRRESLTSAAPPLAIILRDPALRGAFSEWHARIRQALEECGYLPQDVSEAECATLDEWTERFHGWVDNPVLNDSNGARPMFDMRPLHGDVTLFQTLQQSVRQAVMAEPSFVPILAHDSLSNLPPLTIFRDLVVEGTGERSEMFQLERKALRPLVDVARVFGIAAGCVLDGSSIERLTLARTMLPDREAIFREAAETLRVVLSHQARAGIRNRTPGFELQPALLSGHDRQVLKSGFRSILNLLEFTAERRWLAKR